MILAHLFCLITLHTIVMGPVHKLPKNDAQIPLHTNSVLPDNFILQCKKIQIS